MTAKRPDNRNQAERYARRPENLSWLILKRCNARPHTINELCQGIKCRVSYIEREVRRLVRDGVLCEFTPVGLKRRPSKHYQGTI